MKVNCAPSKGLDGCSDGAGVDATDKAAAVTLNHSRAQSSSPRSLAMVPICEYRASMTSWGGLPSEMPMMAWST